MAERGRFLNAKEEQDILSNVRLSQARRESILEGTRTNLTPFMQEQMRNEQGWNTFDSRWHPAMNVPFVNKMNPDLSVSTYERPPGYANMMDIIQGKIAPSGRLGGAPTLPNGKTFTLDAEGKIPVTMSNPRLNALTGEPVAPKTQPTNLMGGGGNVDVFNLKAQIQALQEDINKGTDRPDVLRQKQKNLEFLNSKLNSLVQQQSSTLQNQWKPSWLQ
jgi:hypothetical protein